jgi:hypothetical protein
MQTLLKSLVIATTLVTSSIALTGLAMAGSDGTYHWGYPDGLKDRASVPVQPLGGESGIPAQYR